MTREEIRGKIFDIAVVQLELSTEEAEALRYDQPLEDVGRYGMEESEFTNILCEIKEVLGVSLNEDELPPPCSIEDLANAVERAMNKP